MITIAATTASQISAGPSSRVTRNARARRCACEAASAPWVSIICRAALRIAVSYPTNGFSLSGCTPATRRCGRQQIVGSDREMPDTFARRVMDRVGDRGDRAYADDLTDTLRTKCIHTLVGLI